MTVRTALPSGFSRTGLAPRTFNISGLNTQPAVFIDRRQRPSLPNEGAEWKVRARSA